MKWITRQVKNCMTPFWPTNETSLEWSQGELRWWSGRLRERSWGIVDFSPVQFHLPIHTWCLITLRAPDCYALSKTWPMCSHWPYLGECHIFLYIGYSKFRRLDRGDGVKRTEQRNLCKWRERARRTRVLSFWCPHLVPIGTRTTRHFNKGYVCMYVCSPRQFSFYSPVLISHLSLLSKRPD